MSKRTDPNEEALGVLDECLYDMMRLMYHMQKAKEQMNMGFVEDKHINGIVECSAKLMFNANTIDTLAD